MSLLHLSLRDCPRFYHFLKQRVPYNGYWAMPILSPSECLSILKRTQAPQLSSLELVYMVDIAGSDDELLEYVVEAYPRLSYLELHRYRRDRSEQVDYVSCYISPWCVDANTCPLHRLTSPVFSPR